MPNKVTLTGLIDLGKAEKEVINKETQLTKYSFKISTKRLSGTIDLIPVIYYSTIPLLIEVGFPIVVEGYLSSVNIKQDSKSKLLLAVTAKSIRQAKEGDRTNNLVELEGFLVKKPIYRETPFGRQISDMLIAVNHNNKSSYIPTIAWGRNAKYVSTLEVGTSIKIKGRFQSRTYTKKEGEQEVLKTAYELSVVSILETTPSKQDKE